MDGGDVDAAAIEAKRRVHEAVARVARIKLLFGEDSDAARVAKDVLPELDVARSLAERPEDGAWPKLEAIYRLHRAFNEAAFEMISSPKWRVGRSVRVPYAIEGDRPKPSTSRSRLCHRSRGG